MALDCRSREWWMKTYNLDTIQKVPLREVWPHEAHDFTKWLAEEQNLASLGTAVGIELELIETESSVGSFNVDIYAQESGTGRKVIIENQLEDTNHDHLGKVITYAADKDAEVVVWVVACAHDEHRRAIELCVDDDREIGYRAIARKEAFEGSLGLTAAPFDAKRPRGCASTQHVGMGWMRS